MKKFLIITIFFMSIFTIKQKSYTFFDMCKSVNCEKITVVCKEIEQLNLNFDFVKSGGLYMCEFDIGDKNSIKNICGQILTYEARIYNDEFAIDEVLNFDNMTIIKAENIDNITNLYIYDNSLNSDSIFIDGKRVNLQIAYSSGLICFGSPFIYGSF